MNKKWIVITTINPPTEAIRSISKLAESGWSVVVVGDRKTSSNWNAPNINYISIVDQKAFYGELADIIPYNHYCRKNLGYLYAISRGAECILETDDDNIPYDSFGHFISKKISVRMIGGAQWVNIYKHFVDELIWPRGLPLDEIHSIGNVSDKVVSRSFPIQQYLADLDPDVDAVYRLVLNKEVTFVGKSIFGLEINSWVPFNSQNTLFYHEAFPLLYLPCHVSFRMTDIWRSFVAQQALWIFDYQVAFLPATVKQVRNQHSLMRDFEDEIPGYIENKRIIELLSKRAKTLSPNMGLSVVVRELWGSLNVEGIIPDVEMEILDAWLAAMVVAMKR
jgi:hypothetical protein